jgi:parallel beta-helix repeat protein
MRLIYLILALLIATPSFAATYHIDETYGSGGDGSFATPFDELSDLPSMSTGDDVYLKCGSVFTPTARWLINWGGTSENRAVIGAYYDDGGAVYDTNGTDPEINGSTYTEPLDVQNQSDGGHYTGYDGLVEVSSGNDYVTIENIKITEAGGHGLKILGDGTVGGNVGYFILDNVTTEDTWRAGITVESNPYNYGTIQNCEVSGAAQVFGIGGFSPWNSALNVAHSDHAYTTIKDNYVHENYGEGIDVLTFTTSDAGYVTIQDNIVWDNRRFGIYIDGTNYNTVKRNIVIENDSTSFHATSGAGTCYALHAENYRIGGVTSVWVDATNNTFENNIGIGCGTFFFWNIGSLRPANRSMANNKWYNNTAIAASNMWYIHNNLNGITLTGVEIKDNINYCPSGESCGNIDTDSSWLTALTSTYNAWVSSSPTNIGDSGTDQVTSASWFAPKQVGDWKEITASEFDEAKESAKLDESVGSTSGDADAPSDDFFENTRPGDNTNDPGAHQFGTSISNPRPTSQQLCGSDPQAVTISVESSVAAYCRYSTDSSDFAYSDMSDQFTTGENTTEHSVSVDQACGGFTTYYVICNDGSIDTNRLTIVVDVEAATGEETVSPMIIRGGGTTTVRSPGETTIRYR